MWIVVVIRADEIEVSEHSSSKEASKEYGAKITQPHEKAYIAKVELIHEYKKKPKPIALEPEFIMEHPILIHLNPDESESIQEHTIIRSENHQNVLYTDDGGIYDWIESGHTFRRRE